MGTFIKIVLIVVVIAAGALFFIEGKDGKPLVSIHDLKQPDKALPEVVDKLKEVNPLTAGEPKPKTRVYTWKDEQGNVHYSNQPPETSAAVEQIEINPNQNVIESDKKDEEDKESTQGGAVKLSNLSDNASIYAPERLENEVEKVRREGDIPPDQ